MGSVDSTPSISMVWFIVNSGNVIFWAFTKGNLQLHMPWNCSTSVKKCTIIIFKTSKEFDMDKRLSHFSPINEV